MITGTQTRLIDEKWFAKGWTPGRRDVTSLLASWEGFDAAQKDHFRKAVSTSGHQACLKIIELWETTPARTKGELARFLGRAVFALPYEPALQGWILTQLNQDSDPRVRKGFAQAIGAWIQQAYLDHAKALKAELVEALLVASNRQNLEPPEAKAVMDALSKTGDSRALTAVSLLAGRFEQSQGVARQQLILQRDLARGESSLETLVSMESLITGLIGGLVKGQSKAQVVLEFLPGLEDLALKERKFKDLFDVVTKHTPGVLMGEVSESSHAGAILSNRLMLEVGLVLGTVDLAGGSLKQQFTELLLAGEPLLRSSLQGSNTSDHIRVRFSRGERASRSEVWDFAENLARAANSQGVKIISDGRNAHFSVHMLSLGKQKSLVYVKTQQGGDSRFSYLQTRAPGATQATLSAALVKVAACQKGDHVWDPFCGTGTELQECWIQNPDTLKLLGTDIDGGLLLTAKDISEKMNAKIDWKNTDALSVTEQFNVIITNPPFGMRTVRGEARSLLESFFVRAKNRLKRAGAFVVFSPSPQSTALWGKTNGLRLTESHPVSLGGMKCEIQRFEV